MKGRPGALLAGSLVYLSVVFGVMLWRGISIEPEWVVLALLVIAIAMGRGLTFFAYEAMRGFASKTGFAPHDLSGLEQAVFAGTLPTLTLQHAFYHVESVSPQDVIAMFFYFMHFPLPILVGFVFWLRSREHYHRFIAALLLMAFLAFVTYLFWPSAPPWYQFQEGHASSSMVVHKILNETVEKYWGPNYFVSPLYTHLNPNQFAAFPSLHAAFPALAAVYAWNRYRALAIGLIAWTAAVFVYVAAATVLVEGFVRWRARARPAKPSA